MVFSGISFLLYFFPFVFVLYYALSFSRTLQNIWLLAAGLAFYAWAEPVYIFALLFSIGINWILALIISAVETKNRLLYGFFLFTAYFVNIALWAGLKYAFNIVDIINTLFGKQLLTYTYIAYPVGISFFTLQAISYIADIHRGKIKAEKNIFHLALYLSFFPKLLAGPLIDYKSLKKQMLSRKFDFTEVSEGMRRFCVGFIKKILLANYLAIVSDSIFTLISAGETDAAALLAWLGAFSFMFQLYYDISAYSDMAIGLGKLFGFTLPENMNYPFMAESIREFISAWHISLTSWFKNNVYELISANNTEAKLDIKIRNIFIVCVLVGIWHGAKWNYLFWSLFFFVLISFEHLLDIKKIKVAGIFKRTYVLAAVLFSMIIFRVESVEQFVSYFGCLFGTNNGGIYSPLVYMFLKEYGLIFAAALIFALPYRTYLKNKFASITKNSICINIGGIFYYVSLLCLLFVSFIILSKGAYTPFIYFKF